MPKWLFSTLFLISFIIGGLWASLLGSFTLFLALIGGCFAKTKLSWCSQFLAALGLLIGVFPLWGAVAVLTSDTTTSIVFSLQIILMPCLWLIGAWLQVRFGHRWLAHLKH